MDPEPKDLPDGFSSVLGLKLRMRPEVCEKRNAGHWEIFYLSADDWSICEWKDGDRDFSATCCRAKNGPGGSYWIKFEKSELFKVFEPQECGDV